MLRYPSTGTLIRVIGLVLVAVGAAAVVLILTPRQWQSTARLARASERFDPELTISAVRSGAVRDRLVANPSLLATLGIEKGQDAAASLSLVLADQVFTIAGNDEVWIGVRDHDGDRAHAIATALLEAAEKAETDVRTRLLNEQESTLQANIVERSSRIQKLAGLQPDAADRVAYEVWQARLREAATRLGEAEEDLFDTRRKAAELAAPWIVADPPLPYQNAVPRRIGPALTAAVAAPLLLVCLAMLLPDRKRDR